MKPQTVVTFALLFSSNNVLAYSLVPCANGPKSEIRLAVAEKNEKKIRSLVSSGQDINECPKCYNDKTALADTVSSNDAKMFKLLFELGAKIDSCNKNMLIRATEKGSIEIVGYLIENGVDPSFKSKWRKNENLLITSIQNYQTEMSKFLIEKGADINAFQGSALIQAASYCAADIFELLLKKGVKPPKTIPYGGFDRLTDTKKVMFLGIDHHVRDPQLDPRSPSTILEQAERIKKLIAQMVL